MRIHFTKPLFAWECLEDDPGLKTIREFLALLRDGKLLETLRIYRGKGRNDYPIPVLWGVVLLTILLRHVCFEACLAELRRNKGLREMIGIASEDGVPKKWSVSRFLVVLGTEPFLSMVREVFDNLIKDLGEAVPDLGKDTAGDATHLCARRERSGKEEGQGILPQADGGRKEYTDEAGKVVNVLEWYGYKLHLLVDRLHETVLAYRISSTKRGDNEELSGLVDQARQNLPEGRMRTLAYDKAADSEDVHERLHEEGITPVIQNRSLWKDEQERLLPGHDGQDNIVYDEAGTVYCYDKSSDPAVRHKMAYIGHEAKRGTLKYRCPAMHEGWQCPYQDVCNKGKKYGKTVRVKRQIDFRRFPPIPRATKTFERMYKGRTSVERVNARLKLFWGVDDGNITGARRFHALVGVVMIVHAGLATLLASAPRDRGTLGGTRLNAVAERLRAKQKR